MEEYADVPLISLDMQAQNLLDLWVRSAGADLLPVMLHRCSKGQCKKSKFHPLLNSYADQWPAQPFYPLQDVHYD